MTARPAVILLGGMVASWNHRYLHAAQRRGLEILLLDGAQSGLDELRRAATPGHPLAEVTEHAVQPAEDTGQVLDACLAWARTYDVRGVCCLREEYVPAAALVADLLGLPFPGLRAARVCRNKYLQRRYLRDWGPRAELVVPARRSAAVAAWDRYPAVVKPVGRLASSGVRLVRTEEEAHACLSAYAPEEVLQLEERTIGPEFSVESLSRNGTCRYAEITEKRTTEGTSPYFVELGHTTPPTSLGREDRAALLATHHAVLDRLRFGTGIAHGEYRVTGPGRVVLTEIAARPPGDGIMALHRLATGVSLEDAVVGLAVGEDPAVGGDLAVGGDPALGEDQAGAPPAQRWARQVYLPHPPGTLAGVEVSAPLGPDLTWFDRTTGRDQVPSQSRPNDPPTLHCLVVLKPPGTRLDVLRESADRAAMFVVDAATPAELDRIEADVRDAVRLRITP